MATLSRGDEGGELSYYLSDETKGSLKLEHQLEIRKVFEEAKTKSREELICGLINLFIHHLIKDTHFKQLLKHQGGLDPQHVVNEGVTKSQT